MLDQTNQYNQTNQLNQPNQLLNNQENNFNQYDLHNPQPNLQPKPLTPAKKVVKLNLPLFTKEFKPHVSRIKKYKDEIINPFKYAINLEEYKYVIKAENREPKSLRLYKYEHFFTLTEGMVFGDAALEKQGSSR